MQFLNLAFGAALAVATTAGVQSAAPSETASQIAEQANIAQFKVRIDNISTTDGSQPPTAQNGPSTSPAAFG